MPWKPNQERKFEKSFEMAAMQTIEVIRMKEVPVLRSSVGKISLMMICNSRYNVKLLYKDKDILYNVTTR